MPADDRLTLEWLPGRYAVCRLDPASPLPEWVCSGLEQQAAGLVSIVRTDRELSIVIDESCLPSAFDPQTPIQRGFAALRIVGTLDFALVGLLAKLTGTLASANISVFVMSTYDTDIVMVREHDRDRAAAALSNVAMFDA